MITNVKTFSAFETSIILHKYLGELRAWGDFLADNIRFKQNIDGFTLLPCARKKGRTGLQPRYAADDILNFIRNVKAAIPGITPGAIKPVTLAIDSRKHWRFNKFDRNGKACRKVFAGAGTH